MQYTSMNTLVYADVSASQTSAASTIAATGQQLAISFGVAGAALVAAIFVPTEASFASRCDRARRAAGLFGVGRAHHPVVGRVHGAQGRRRWDMATTTPRTAATTSIGRRVEAPDRDVEHGGEGHPGEIRQHQQRRPSGRWGGRRAWSPARRRRARRWWRRASADLLQAEEHHGPAERERKLQGKQRQRSAPGVAIGGAPHAPGGNAPSAGRAPSRPGRTRCRAA